MNRLRGNPVTASRSPAVRGFQDQGHFYN